MGRGGTRPYRIHGLSSPIKRLETLPGFSHAIFHEKGRQIVISKARQFISECFGRPPQRVSLGDADKHGFAKDEYDRLSGPRGPLFTLARLAMKTVGRLSRGIRLGWEAGFDSGRTLDYVYENKPQDISPPGRMIDRAYLNSIGWRGIRQRKVNLQRLLREVIESMHAEGQSIRLLDIASGPGRYVLETIRDLAPIPITAILRDYQFENVAAARRLAEKFGLENVTAIQGDAFDGASLASLTPKFNLAIVSGLAGNTSVGFQQGSAFHRRCPFWKGRSNLTQQLRSSGSHEPTGLTQSKTILCVAKCRVANLQQGLRQF